MGSSSTSAQAYHQNIKAAVEDAPDEEVMLHKPERVDEIYARDDDWMGDERGE